MSSPGSTALLPPSNKPHASLRGLIHHLQALNTVFGLSSVWIVHILKGLVPKLLSNPHVAEILRFIFLGTVVESTRLVGQKAADFVKHFFIVKASFTRGDFAFDWVLRYLEEHRVWNQSRIFRVAACSPTLRRGKRAGLGQDVRSDSAQDLEDGRPHPVYQPAPEEPVLFRWRGHWISVGMNLDSAAMYNDDNVQVLTLSVWSRSRKILDDFVQDARTHYFNSPSPPRELYVLPDECGSLLTARFEQGDTSYDWILAFLHAQDGFEQITDLQVTTKQSDLHNLSGHPSERPLVGFKPAPRVKQRLKWNDHWLQFDVEPSSSSYEGRAFGGSVTVTIHNSKRSILEKLVEAAHEEYLSSTVSKVTVHLADRYGSWAKCVTKNRRALNTLILPEGVREELVKDAREFLDSEEWYMWAGVPHRRGYLLYGEPGTGKSSTIHALASELGLEIYYVQLGSQGMDDQNLASLIAATPSRCILLIEDIDCAFPSREDDDDDDQPTDMYGNPIPFGFPPRTSVTLSGLLNVLDSVTSEEGRITFATTNHVERLDPALVRAGRMDVKVEYKLASRHQIHQTYLRFFERRFTDREGEPSRDTKSSGLTSSRLVVSNLDNSLSDEQLHSEEEIETLAQSFADAIPEYTFALAQVQGYLLTKKAEARAAVDGAANWVEEQIAERRKMEELKEKRRMKRMERKTALEAAVTKERLENEKDKEDNVDPPAAQESWSSTNGLSALEKVNLRSRSDSLASASIDKT